MSAPAQPLLAKPLPAALTPDLLRTLARRHGTPLWVYDAATLQARIAALHGFDAIRYAQKANANTHLLRLMRAAGVQVDAVSLGEIRRALAAGYAGMQGEDACASGIVFTADVIDAATLDAVVAHRIPVNTGSIDMLAQVGGRAPGHPVWLRVNPGFGHGHSSKTNTGGEDTKHGIWHAQLDAALTEVRRHGLRLVGLHMHIGSGADYAHLARVGEAMVAAVRCVPRDLPLQAISTGGGLSIPYLPGGVPVDTAHYATTWNAARRRIEAERGHPVHLEIEPGRFLVAECGVLLAEVRATKLQGSRHFTLLDAGFNDLVRPSMYGGYHAISILPGDARPRALRATVVAGPLCESGDVFTQAPGGLLAPRELPEAAVGDLAVIHDAGAYGASMSSLYNSRPLAAEVLVEAGGARVIRRRQTIEELIALETSAGPDAGGMLHGVADPGAVRDPRA